MEFVNYANSTWWRTGTRAEVLLAAYDNTKKVLADAWYNATTALCVNSNYSALQVLIAGTTLQVA